MEKYNLLNLLENFQVSNCQIVCLHFNWRLIKTWQYHLMSWEQIVKFRISQSAIQHGMEDGRK